MTEQDEKMLREMLFLRHGHYSLRYDDGGEMQCSTCGIDFKRMTPREIRDRFNHKAASRIHDMQELQDLRLIANKWWLEIQAVENPTEKRAVRVLYKIAANNVDYQLRKMGRIP